LIYYRNSNLSMIRSAKNKHMKTILSLSIALLCISCKQHVAVGGVILDEKTGKPIAKVYISQNDIYKNRAVIDLDSSDQNGRYNYEYPLTGKLTHSVFMTLYFYKDGGELSRNIRNGVQNDTIFWRP
jgi:hypothetical protein